MPSSVAYDVHLGTERRVGGVRADTASASSARVYYDGDGGGELRGGPTEYGDTEDGVDDDLDI